MLEKNGYKFKHESASVVVKRDDEGLWWVSNLLSTEPRKGHATVLMNQVCKWSDEHKVALNLFVKRFGKDFRHIPNKDLPAFYEKFGFRIIPNKNERRLMVRLCDGDHLASSNVDPTIDSSTLVHHKLSLTNDHIRQVARMLDGYINQAQDPESDKWDPNLAGFEYGFDLIEISEKIINERNRH